MAKKKGDSKSKKTKQKQVELPHKKKGVELKIHQLDWIAVRKLKEQLGLTVKKYDCVRLLNAAKEFKKKRHENITESLIEILGYAIEDKLTIGIELVTGKKVFHLFFDDTKDIREFKSLPYREDITTNKIGTLASRYVPANLKGNVSVYNYEEKNGKFVKTRKYIDGKPVPRIEMPIFIQASELPSYGVSIYDLVIVEEEWKRFKEWLKTPRDTSGLKQGGSEKRLSKKDDEALEKIIKDVIEKYGKYEQYSLQDLANRTKEEIEKYIKKTENKEKTELRADSYKDNTYKQFIGNLRKCKPMRYKKS